MPEEIKKEFNELPEEEKKKIVSEKVTEMISIILEGIGKRYGCFIKVDAQVDMKFNK